MINIPSTLNRIVIRMDIQINQHHIESLMD